MSDKASVCEVLQEFQNFPGFPATNELRREEYWRTTYRKEAFRAELDAITESVCQMFGGEIHAGHLRMVAARAAVTKWRYDPIAEPEPAPPTDPVDELDAAKVDRSTEEEIR